MSKCGAITPTMGSTQPYFSHPGPASDGAQSPFASSAFISEGRLPYSCRNLAMYDAKSALRPPVSYSFAIVASFAAMPG
ncbi:hypothetical protein LAUMK42_02664 [Mycobacterium persicum]|uniref:Uncharacterized protein n=1 Tax=Mycobacterium persicum TaxID=1487726 RepID=A0AB38UTV7_9MYCO|nr:hypothetical protein LAUMK42_02664 [Mycobacterium persicum]